MICLLDNLTCLCCASRYRRYSGKVRLQNEQFIELFDTDLVNMPTPEARCEVRYKAFALFQLCSKGLMTVFASQTMYSVVVRSIMAITALRGYRRIKRTDRGYRRRCLLF